MKGKKIIIDGYNLIKSPLISFPDSDSLEAQREHLLRILQSYPALRNRQVTVVFDGGEPFPGPHSYKYGHIQFVFSGPKKQADDVIQRMIRKAPRPAELHIVTSDRRIQFTARDHGAEVTDSPAFWKMLHATPGPTGSEEHTGEKPADRLSDREVKEWLKRFQNRANKENED